MVFRELIKISKLILGILYEIKKEGIFVCKWPILSFSHLDYHPFENHPLNTFLYY